MQLKTDADTFDEHQKLLIREIIEQIRFKLAAAGYRGDKIKDLVCDIAFSVASTIDDTAKIESEGTEVRPYLTFRDEDDQLIHCGENSYMHEYVSSLIDEVFSN